MGDKYSQLEQLATEAVCPSTRRLYGSRRERATQSCLQPEALGT